MKAFFGAVLVLISTMDLGKVDAAETIYFLVGEPPGRVRLRDSYVLPLSRQEHIDHARYLISRGELVFVETDRPLVVAAVVPGKDGINRNYLDPRLPEWSWHVREFRGFGDYTAEVLDGSPTWVENEPAWYRGEDGRQGLIGFWNYTVVRELGPQPLYLSIAPNGQNLQFYWSSAGTNANYAYTLESNDSLSGTNWKPLPNANWPLKTNQWALPLTNTTTRFYRLRAEQSNQ